MDFNQTLPTPQKKAQISKTMTITYKRKKFVTEGRGSKSLIFCVTSFMNDIFKMFSEKEK